MSYFNPIESLVLAEQIKMHMTEGDIISTHMVKALKITIKTMVMMR